MPAVTILSLPQVLNLSLTASLGAAVMNYPVNRTDFRVLKGVRNDIDIFIRNVDRKPVDLTGQTVTVVIANDDTARVLMRRAATVVAPGTTGRCRLTITPEDTLSWPLGTLRYSTLISNSDGTASALYTDRDYRHGGMIEVDQGPYPAPRASIEVSLDEYVPRDGFLWAGAYPASVPAGQEDGIQTVQVYTTDFTGTLTVQASLAPQPTQDDVDWFDVQVETYTASTGTTGFNVVGRFLWVRFKIATTTGTLDRIVYRTSATTTNPGETGQVLNTVSITMFAQGVIDTAETLAIFPVTQGFILPFGMAASLGFLGVAATDLLQLSIRKNGNVVGTVDFAPGATQATFSMPTETEFEPGDVLSIVSLNGDLTARDLGLTLTGTA